MNAIVPKGQRRGLKTEKGPLIFGVGLQDAREEIFVRMVCDGLALGIAFERAGFKSTNASAATNLFRTPRLQERAAAILEARRTTGVVTLPQVTDMLQRVFAGSLSEGEYSAAHNAAFSLARLYGHVTDKSTLEVIRRPSRDPDAPSEQALEAWVSGLPSGPLLDHEPAPDQGLSPSPKAERNPELSPLSSPPAPLLDPSPQAPTASPATLPSNINGLAPRPEPSQYHDTTKGSEARALDWGLSNDFNGLEGEGTPVGVRGRPENGAPVGPVTETPLPCGHSDLLAEGVEGTTPPGGEQKTGEKAMRVPAPTGGVVEKARIKTTKYPPIEDLF